VTFVLDDVSLMNYKHKLKIVNLASFNYFKRIFLLRKSIKKFKPNIIIGQSSLDCMYLYLSLFFTQFKYISYVHGSLFWLENDFLKYALIHKQVFNKIRNSVVGHKQFVSKKINKTLFQGLFYNLVALVEYFGVRKAKAVIVLTKQIKWEVKKLYNKNSIIIRGCIDKKLFNYKPKIKIKKRHNIKNKTVILSVGRLDYRKRIDVLIKSFFNLCSNHRNLVLMIGGKGPDKERLTKIINEPKYKKHRDKVIMLGFVKNDEYFDYLAGCDIFAFPSWTTSGIPTYEALAIGKKVIWTTEAEEPILKHLNVYLADPTVTNFTKAIEKSLNSKLCQPPNLREHTWDKYFGKLFVLAKKVVKKDTHMV